MSGLPLLSGPPPVIESTRADDTACRKCNKRRYAGYLYCNSCSDYQGLMPRTGSDTGYDVMNVCAYCIELLTITAGGRGHLKSLPLAKLRKYINAYHINADRAVEKDDLIDAILAAKASATLAPAYNFPRPDLAPDEPPAPPPRYAPPPGPPPRSPNATRPQPHPRPQPQNYPPPRHPAPPIALLAQLNATNDRTPPRARAASVAPPPTVPAPTLDQLLTMSADSVSALSVHALKSILFTNHVNPGSILEKSDLVKKVADLVEEERRQRERQRQAELLEEQEKIEQQRASSSANPPPLPPKAQAMASHLERTGLCVICQDEEASIAIVDCGHLAMCRGCSDLVMESSRECPLCRTRIVSGARLLRIFKT
ncbi:hypothetical protein B0H17DRAFT_1071559 [Mycena rosella]|uniref:RING-type domain-containing protein n=1 Tax=Mycena rosella TaxID=1033263 RepID=A0AAD7DA67_MYCRO|nr:hypothetical protein B0H17DRAFT_1071559 [Mycena rosella]